MQLPNSSLGHYEVPHLGAFSGQSVGNTAHTTGYDVAFHREGKEECEHRRIRFVCQIKDKAIKWVPTFDPDLVWATPAVLHFAEKYVAALPARDPHGYLFQVLGAAEIEYNTIQQSLSKLRQRVQDYSLFLAHPNAPIKEFVQASPKGYYIPAGEAFRRQRREEWAQNLERARRRLAIEEGQDATRGRYLDNLIRMIRTWCKQPQTREQSIIDIIDKALAFEPAE